MATTVTRQRLVDYFVVVGGDATALGPAEILKPELALKPCIIDRFPATDYDDTPFVHNVAAFTFPQGFHLKGEAGEPLYYTFVLTALDGSHLYVSALVFYESGPDIGKFHRTGGRTVEQGTSFPKALLLVSHWAFPEMFKDILTQIFLISKSQAEIPLERYISNFVLVEFTVGTKCVWCSRPPVNQLPLCQYRFEVLFSTLDARNVLLLWEAILIERRVVIKSTSFSVVTEVVECIKALCFPLKWPHVYIPLLPVSLLGFLEAPTPFIIGVNSDYPNLDESIPEDTVIVDLDCNQVVAPDLPPLPEKETSKLKERLRELGVRFVFEEDRSEVVLRGLDLASQDEFYNLFGVDKGDLRTKEIREAFLRFFTALLKNYSTFVVTQGSPDGSADDLLSSGGSGVPFRFADFIADAPKGSRAFLEQLSETQMFSIFIQNRVFNQDEITLDDRFQVVFFDECIDAKVNRSRRKLKKTETPFLSDQRFVRAEVVAAQPPDSTGVPNKMYTYDHFPRLRPEYLVPSRYAHPLAARFHDELELLAVAYSRAWTAARKKTVAIGRKTAADGSLAPRKASIGGPADAMGPGAVQSRMGKTDVTKLYGAWFQSYLEVLEEQGRPTSTNAFEFLSVVNKQSRNMPSFKHIGGLSGAAAPGEGGDKTPDLITYSSTIYALSQQEKDLPFAFQTLADMRQAGLKPNRIVYGALIGGCCKANMIAHAMKLYKEMKGAEMEPDLTVYRSLIECSARVGRPITAKEVFHELEDSHCLPDLDVYLAMIDVLSNHGFPSEAVTLVDQMQKESFRPDAFMYSLVIRGFGKENMLERAFEMPRLAEDAGVSMDVTMIDALVEACGRCREPGRALSTFEKMKAMGLKPQGSSFNALIMAFAQAGDLKSAYVTVDKMIESGFKKKGDTYAALIEGHGLVGELETCFDLLDQQRDVACIKPGKDVYCKLILACGQCGDLDRARRTFNEMAYLVCAPDLEAYTMLSLANALCGNIPGARKIMVEMGANGYQPSPEIFNTLIRKLGEDMKYGEALELRDEMKNKEISASRETFNALVHAAVESGEFAAAMGWFEEMVAHESQSLQPNTDTYISLIRGAGNALDADAALSLYEQAKLHEEGRPTLGLYEAIMAVCANLGRVSEGRGVLQDCSRVGLEPVVAMHEDMVRACMTMTFGGVFGKTERRNSRGQVGRKSGRILSVLFGRGQGAPSSGPDPAKVAMETYRSMGGDNASDDMIRGLLAIAERRTDTSMVLQLIEGSGKDRILQLNKDGTGGTVSLFVAKCVALHEKGSPSSDKKH